MSPPVRWLFFKAVRAADMASTAHLDEPQQGFARLDGFLLKVTFSQHVFWGVR
jgi:hypothetical protein